MAALVPSSQLLLSLELAKEKVRTEFLDLIDFLCHCDAGSSALESASFFDNCGTSLQ